MNLLLLEPGEVDGEGHAVLSGRRAEHAREVLRVAASDVLQAGIRGGLVGTATVLSATKSELSLRVQVKDPAPPRPGVDLILAVPRPKALKRVVQAVASMGVDRVMLVNAARVEKSYFDSKVLAPEFLRELITLGLEQGKDTVGPVFEQRTRFKPFIEDELAAWAGDAQRLLLHPAPPGAPLTRTGRVVLAIGPDGGWVPFEVDLFKAHGFHAVSFGTRPLRVEVAVAAALGRFG
jgi:RsmE family RNA methyltransferase